MLHTGGVTVCRPLLRTTYIHGAMCRQHTGEKFPGVDAAREGSSTLCRRRRPEGIYKIRALLGRALLLLRSRADIARDLRQQVPLVTNAFYCWTEEELDRPPRSPTKTNQVHNMCRYMAFASLPSHSATLSHEASKVLFACPPKPSSASQDRPSVQVRHSDTAAPSQLSPHECFNQSFSTPRAAHANRGPEGRRASAQPSDRGVAKHMRCTEHLAVITQRLWCSFINSEPS